MHLMHKFISFSFRRNVIEKFTLNLERMPNDKSKKILRGISYQPNVQVVGSGGVGLPSNIILTTGDARYLINFGEGSSKLGNEYKINLSRVQHIFITSPLWKNIGGIVGLILSNQKNPVGEIFIHGHGCIENLFYGLSHCISLRYIQPKIKKSTHYEQFTDKNITVKYVHLYKSSSTPTTPDKGESSENEFFSDMKEDSFVGKKINKRMKNSSTDFVISYILETKKVVGTLHFDKCVDFGVPPGPLLGKLKSGKDVTLENGKTVRSVDVKDPDLPGSIIIAVECPTVDYLNSLLEEPIFKKYMSGTMVAEAVIHFSTSEVVKQPQYQEWISLFPKKTKHLFLNESNKSSGSVSIYRQQFKLNYLAPSLFPMFPNTDIPDFPRAENCTTEEGHVLLQDPYNVNCEPLYSDSLFYKCESNSIINAETLCTLSLNPKSNYDYMKCLVLKKHEFLNEMFSRRTKEDIDLFKEKIKELELTLESNKRIYPKIAFLGTGSGKPSKVRNASGILVFIEENKCILLDCGENTYNQLVNFYGVQKVEEILRNLVAIYVSHLHVDHHLGLITLLKERKLAIDKEIESLNKSNAQVQKQVFQPVYLLAPLGIRRWLTIYSEEFENILGMFTLLPNSFLEENSKEIMDLKENCLKSLNLNSLMTARVKHCQGAYGISLVHKDGWKITYSGDTRPCDALVKLGMGSDILIHEATFEDAYAYEAVIKKHSTTAEAISVGMKMNAKFILLTHFSQRYCYLPVIEDYLKDLKIGIAFDFMEVPFNKLPLLTALFEPLRYIFSEHDKKNQPEIFSQSKRTLDEANLSTNDLFVNSGKSAKIMRNSEF